MIKRTKSYVIIKRKRSYLVLDSKNRRVFTLVQPDNRKLYRYLGKSINYALMHTPRRLLKKITNSDFKISDVVFHGCLDEYINDCVFLNTDRIPKNVVRVLTENGFIETANGNKLMMGDIEYTLECSSNNVKMVKLQYLPLLESLDLTNNGLLFETDFGNTYNSSNRVLIYKIGGGDDNAMLVYQRGSELIFDICSDFK